MGKHPINLAVRFLLEIAALFVFAYWGWEQFMGWKGVLLAVALPLCGAFMWGVFAVKNDPSRSGKTVVKTRGIIRLLIELEFFALAALALFNLDIKTWAIVLSVLVLLHYAFSYDRIIWLLRQ